MIKNHESEDDICMAIIEWAQYHPILTDYLSHIANERKTKVQYHVKLKKMGVRKGISDFLLAYPNGKYHGLWIEVKTLPKRLSKLKEEQKLWLNRMNKIGYCAVATFGFDETKETINNYLKCPNAIEIVYYIN